MGKAFAACRIILSYLSQSLDGYSIYQAEFRRKPVQSEHHPATIEVRHFSYIVPDRLHW